VSTIKCCF